MLASPEIDAVFVLTNLETHLEYTKLALDLGKHVLVEKPVGVTVGEIEQMKAAAAAKSLVCLPGHNYVYEASMTRTRELVDNGDLGRIVSAYVMYNIHHPEEVAKRYPGVVRQILTHHSYILLYLVGKPVGMCAMKATLHYKEYPEEDIAMVQMRLHNGALAHFCASFAADDHAADPWTVMVKVIGTAGSTRYSYRDHVEIKPGLAVMAMIVQPHMVNGQRICHGGFIFTLADSAFAFACNSHNERAVAAQGNITFIRPGKLGDRLVAAAREISRSGRSGIYDVRVTVGDSVIAEFRGHSRVIPGTWLPDTDIKRTTSGDM